MITVATKAGKYASPVSPSTSNKSSTATDPESVTCKANLMGPFIGQPADEAVRAQILTVATGASEVRFVQSGSAYVRPDATNPRLNLMIDNLGIIRDARCG